MRLRIPVRCLASRLLFVGAGLVAPFAGAVAAGSDEEALDKLHREIVAIIGDPRCENIVHCRLLELGSRPCGGPAEYLPYSSIIGAKREVLEAKAYEYTFLHEEVQRAHPVAGTCEVLPKPRLACVNERCRAEGDRR